jgi:hypothetical protein
VSPLVQLIIGNKGRGKTRYLLEKVNYEVKDTLGNICYLDKSSKHMFELNNRVRLINVSDFAIENTDQFIGFICGIISQDHDLEQMYFDSFLKIAHLEGQDITAAIKRIQKIGDMFGVSFIISIAMDKEEVPAEFEELIAVAL